MTSPPSIAVVDNHQSVQRGVQALIEEHAEEFRFAGAYDDPAALLAAHPAPDVVLLDLWLERDDADSSWAIPGLRETGCAVVLFTTEERPVPLRRAVCAGAMGLVLKNDGESALLDALRTVLAGEFACSGELAAALINDDGAAARLTEREIEVLGLIADGLTKHQVATRLHLSPSTVRTHMERVRDKYLALGRDIPNTTSLVRAVQDDGYGASGISG